MKKLLTDQQKIEIVEKYKAGMSTIELGKEYDRAKSNIRAILIRRNVKMRTYKEGGRVYTLNQNYFNTIDTEAKAYFLGLMYADGHVFSRKRKNRKNTWEYSAHISLKEADSFILDLFNKELESNKPLETLTAQAKSFGTNKIYQCNNQIRLNIYSEIMYFDLVKLGCVEKKSLILEFPTNEQVPTHLIHHFIRGYFDGDGCICIHKRSSIFNVVGSLQFCEKINQLLYNIGLSHTKIVKRKNIFVLQHGGNENCKRLAKFLYNDANFFLKRKKDKFDLILNKSNLT